MNALRRVLFWFFAVAYLVLCPTVILYALGYLHSGLISVRSVPPDARVLMGGRPIGATTPVEISGLPSGDYEVTVAADGYLPWKQVASVRRGQATVLDHVLLLPEKPVIETLDTASYEKLLPIASAPFFLLLRGRSAADWRVFDLEDETLRPLIPPGLPFADARIGKVFRVPGSTQLILVATLYGETIRLRLDLSGDPIRIDDVTEQFAGRWQRVLWDPAEPDILFALQEKEGRVRKVDLSTEEDDPQFGVGWRAIGVFDGRVHGILDDGRVVAMRFDKSSPEAISDDPKAGRQLFGEQTRFTIEPLDGEIILYLGTNGRLCQNGLPNLLVEDGVRGLEVSPVQRRALVWTRESLGMLDASTDAGSRQGGRFEKGRQVSWLFEEGTDIEAAAFMHGGSHAVILDDGQLSILELFPGVRPRPRTVTRLRKGGGIRYSAKRGVVYGLDPERGRLLSVKVAPPATSLPIPFGDAPGEP